jgi:hypothetical protein
MRLDRASVFRKMFRLQMFSEITVSGRHLVIFYFHRATIAGRLSCSPVCLSEHAVVRKELCVLTCILCRPAS